MEKIIEAFNAIVFKTPRYVDSIHSISELSEEVQDDFLGAFLDLVSRKTGEEDYINSFIMDFGKKNDFCSQKSVACESHVCLNLQLLNSGKDFLNGIGFTPFLATHTHDDVSGLNCLAKTIILGVLIKRIGHRVKLGLTHDHAVVVIRTISGDYVADPNCLELQALHGTYEKSYGYEWYDAVKEDNVVFRHLVIHEFNAGIINAILEHFAFLKQANEQHAKKSGLLESEVLTLVLNDARYGLRSRIHRFNWAMLQKKYCAKLNEYRIERESECLIEEERLRRYRILHAYQVSRYDSVILTAFEKATGQKSHWDEINKFLSENRNLLLNAWGNLADLFSRNEEFEISLEFPPLVGKFMQFFFTEIKSDEQVKSYFISRYKSVEYAA